MDPTLVTCISATNSDSFQLDNVYEGNSIVMDYWSGLSAIVKIKYSSSSGEPFVHLPEIPAYPPKLPMAWTFHWVNKYRDQFDKVICITLTGSVQSEKGYLI